MGKHIDRDPEIDPAAPHMNLIMRGVGAALTPAIDHPPREHPIPVGAWRPSVAAADLERISRP